MMWVYRLHWKNICSGLEHQLLGGPRCQYSISGFRVMIAALSWSLFLWRSFHSSNSGKTCVRYIDCIEEVDVAIVTLLIGLWTTTLKP